MLFLDADITGSFVLDSSVTLAWCFEDEDSALADAVLTKLHKENAVTPSLWSIEVANILIVGESRKRLTHADVSQFLTMLEGFPIHVELKTPMFAFHNILALARQLGLTTYDAAYLEMSLRYDLPLATLDKELIAAAKKTGVKLVTV